MQYSFQVDRINVQVTAALKGSIYEKTLKLSAQSRSQKGTGDIVNFLTVDVSRVTVAFLGLHNAWLLPLQIVVAMTMLWEVVGAAMFAGVMTILTVLALNGVLASYTEKASAEVMKCKDERMKVLTEVFSSIQVVKLGALECPAEEQILAARQAELHWVRTVLLLTSINVFVLWLAPLLVSSVTFTVYVLCISGSITAARIFTALALFRLLQEPLRTLPGYITQAVQAKVSIDRLSEFFNLGEVSQVNMLKHDSNHGLHEPTASAHGPMVRVSDASYCWEAGGMVMLHDVNLVVPTGDLVVVQGPVGSGKTSLCMALLGEMERLSGMAECCTSSIAYTAQVPWIENATLRNNVLCGCPYDAEWYARVMKACCLEEDIKQLGGDDIEIGEKGHTLSGGQRARVALARACYCKASLYVLDDVLAAVDSHVAKAIFESCICGLLAGTTRIMVTHHPDVISSTFLDQLISMEEGRLTVCEGSQGVSTELMTSHNSLADDDRTLIVSEGESDMASKNSSNGPVSSGSGAEEQIGREQGGEVVGTEEREVGRVTFAVYKSYMGAFAGGSTLVFLLCVQICWQAYSSSYPSHGAYKFFTKSAAMMALHSSQTLALIIEQHLCLTCNSYMGNFDICNGAWGLW